MQRGPKPTPTALRLLTGGGPREDRPNEPMPPAADMPACPDWLSGWAQDEWLRVAEILYGMGVLTEVDQTAMAAYCMSYSAWRKAEEDLMRAQDAAREDPADKTSGGALMETTNGNLVQSPLVGIANVARREMLRLATEFGLTPSARVLIEGAKRGESDPVATRYFGRK